MDRHLFWLPLGPLRSHISSRLYERSVFALVILILLASVVVQGQKSSPQSAEAHNALGLALARKGELKLAVESFRRALELDPKHYKAHRNLGMALQQLGDIDGAIAAFKQSTAIKPDEAETRLLLGLAIQKKGDADGAIAEFREAIRLNPKLAEGYFYLGFVLGAKGLRRPSLVLKPQCGSSPTTRRRTIISARPAGFQRMPVARLPRFGRRQS